MGTVGYFLGSEDRSPRELVEGARLAEQELRLSTAVTCPTMRIHPVLVAQAAATCSVLMEGRFGLGIGAGENLNEHILGAEWPTPQTRLEMLEEAVDVIRQLWSGATVDHHGRTTRWRTPGSTPFRSHRRGHVRLRPQLGAAGGADR